MLRLARTSAALRPQLFTSFHLAAFCPSKNPAVRSVRVARLLGQSSRGFATHQEKVPSLGDSISEGTVVEWVKQVGDYVEADEVFVVLETDKVSVDIRAQTSGVITSTAAAEGETVQVGADLAVIDDNGERPAAVAAAEAPTPPAAPTAVKVVPAPVAQTTAAPSVPHAPTPAAAAKTGASSVAAASPLARNERAVPMSRMRQTIAKRLKVAQNTAAMLTTFNEIDMHALMELRAKHKEEFAVKHGVKLGFMSAFVKASSAALMKAPAVNAFFDLDNKQIVYKDYVDVSIAVATPTGLVVPVLRNTESMNMAQVESAIGNFGQKARAGQISMEDMSGGTFTISNGGVYGSLMGTPILNPPQSAILGMHGIFKRPVVVDGQVVIRPMMYVALSYDHRIIDGSDGVLFLKDIKNMIEDPTRLLLDL